MAAVGFLTFGFTQATCPTSNTTIEGNAISSGYLAIKGWAYMLSDWNNHPGSNGTTNVLYDPLNGAGMDATLLFPQTYSECDNVYIPLQGKQVNYFPCALFNPNTTAYPDVSQYTNRTSCHTSTTSTSLLSKFSTQGVPKKDGSGFDKISRIYYSYQDVNSTNHLMIYNNIVLNLNLLKSLPPTYFSVPKDGLISNILNNMDNYGGKDLTYVIQSYRGPGIQWSEEANCLMKTIRVGQVDTMTVGCMISEIVLYVSLVVILAVIGAKFIFAVIFGWFLSWKLGNFKEERSYSARMRREQQIEEWARNLDTNGPVAHIPPPPTQHHTSKRKSIFPVTSRFTPLEHGSTRFDSGKLSMPAWKNNGGSRPNSVLSYSQSGLNLPTYHQRYSSTSFSHQNTYTNSWDNRSHDSTSNASQGGSRACPFALSPYAVPQPPSDYMPFNYPLAHTMCLVTCYSEGEDGIRTTLDSICMSDYPKSHTLLVVICDGLITGSGESRSTPDVCVDMMRDLIVPADQVQAQPYVAIADGSRRNNCAKVYAGFYKFDDRTVPPDQQSRVPMITIVKCGGPEETNAAKPGNRGKRDSQIILMQFLQKVMFDERMTMMEYDFFNAIWRITGVSADNYEICLMVDADTKLFPDALSRMISAAVKDPEISGMCGETKIANKTASWVSMIQVFEYYISHHQTKAFESIFGCVTCLPGCFCMYRIKAPKGPNGYWVPILANPDIVEHYSENVVDTLHRKNLLLLGEDRYLTTLMLKTFPNRKMMFIPQAVCKTVVPDTFMVLLSQRRRWINSTVHNLFELLLVNDLCGTFCFSMQFVVFMELVGTLALPAAISFTLYLVVTAIMGKPAVLPLILLALVLGLPAVLIGMTSCKLVYVGWMLIYLVSLLVWNFVLPMYAYWHFDDFSWGDTRKVEGVKKDKGHGEEGGLFDSSLITMKKWSEYEMDRRIKLAKDNNLPIPQFARHQSELDIFVETSERRPNRYSNLSSESGNIPLTQMDYGSPLGILGNESKTSRTESRKKDFEIEEIMKPSIGNHEIGWISSSQDNNWADPAPHHSTVKMDDLTPSPSSSSHEKS
ncbi:chitin synthase [Sporodiniella umbellata]|nr:chitin synthase [Sporodiniella umbellata]